MSIIDEVTSLPLSKKLKALGVKQESCFYWYIDPISGKAEILLREHNITQSYKPWKFKHINEWYSAYLSSELGKMLPYRLRNINIDPLLNDDFWMKIEKLKHDNCFEIRYVSVKGVTVTEIIQNINLVNCLGYKLVELIKFNHVKPEDI